MLLCFSENYQLVLLKRLPYKNTINFIFNADRSTFLANKTVKLGFDVDVHNNIIHNNWRQKKKIKIVSCFLEKHFARAHEITNVNTLKLFLKKRSKYPENKFFVNLFDT